MITVVAPMEEILRVEPGYYSRPGKDTEPKKETTRGDTLGCPCDTCLSRSECKVYCVKFQSWVREGKSQSKS
ncbi:hypothetical protein [Endozoicomonas sp. SESOKO4]|uniref:hypothetical protein n=1 Tax=Endozoicomonas sp. SESOKO4 TaxID=2828745 RepID=UPI0021486664|nr:hypothetical protein [Endozoicomonas sp. SESOKO4]